MAKLVVKRYASALFDLAQEENLMQQYQEEVSLVRDVLKNEPEFMGYLEDPKFELRDKKELMLKIFDGKISDPIVGLLILMLEKGRQHEIIEVLNSFIEQVLEATGIVKAVVTTATPLSDKQLSALQKKLETSTQRKIDLHVVVDPSILAGLIVRVGDKVVDASYKGEIDAMKRELNKIKLA